MIRKMLNRQRGQALTEFVVALPTMVVIFLFSQYFYEAIQVKLKTQEMARYAAYEFTGQALHDYKDGSMKFSNVKGNISSDSKKRFSNLKSTDNKNDANKALAGEWNVKTLRVRDTKEPKIPGGTMANTVLMIVGYALDAWRIAAIAQHPNIIYAITAAWYTVDRHTTFGGGGMNVFNTPKDWKFNDKGYVSVESKITFKNLFIPKSFYDDSWHSVKMPRLKRLQFKEKHILLADSWKLNYGDDIEGPGSSDKAFYKQVERMAFIRPKVRNLFRQYFNLIKIMSNVTAYLAFQPALSMNDLTETALVSKNYTDANSGKIDIEEDGGKKTYDTAPFLGDGYQKTLETRGEHYMACPEQESLGCTSSLSTDNPFGDYIIPEEVE